MTAQDREILLGKLTASKGMAFMTSMPQVLVLKDIVGQLNALDQEDKYFFSEFASALQSDMFLKGVTFKGLDLNQFKNSTPLQPPVTNKDKEPVRISEVQTDFIDLFNKLTENLNDHFEILKAYFITRLENNPLESYALTILYDKTFFIQPIKKKILAISSNAVFREIEEYKDELETGTAQGNNLLCLILLHPRTNDEQGILKLCTTLSVIIDSYKYFECFSLKKSVGVGAKNHESSISKEDFFEEVKYVNGTLLSNGTIKHEEEKIIKKLCSNFRTPLIIYKTLKGGNSGSKVIEVRPKKELGPDHEKRYIIKFSAKENERKIAKEYEYFGKFIEGYKGFNDYECKYDKTLCHEGLRYSYAISDTASESFSYNDILNNNDNIFNNGKVSIIEDLFSVRLFDTWRDSLEAIECEVRELYEPYVNIEKTLVEVAKILNLNSEQTQAHELYINFQKIWSCTFKFQQKICHGDLHSENFFKDNNGIYLIDFGYTGVRHSLIDHTSLECSVKFKHIPFYISIDELKDVEDELIFDSSFQLSTRFTKTSRPDLIDMLEVIKKIRNNSVPLIADNNSITEYLISLFIMTFRQIRYKDMNQLYAFNSALILGRKLVQILGL